MPRYKLTIEYDGTPFVGWQAQAHGVSVQGCLEAAVTAFTGEARRVAGAGRTDAGVHAIGQVAHLDLAKAWPVETVRDALNSHLRPQPIVVLACAAVSDDFEARFSARQRHYRYRIACRRAPAALERHRVWQVPRELDAEAMQVAAGHLIGHHDFTTFRSAHCQARSPVKTLDGLAVADTGTGIEIEARARSFLHHQVRSMVGALKRVGEGKWRPDQVASALAARDRSRCAPVAPAHGLYLVAVSY